MTVQINVEEILGKGAARPRSLGPYELRSELGRGGMGIVYRAYHHSLRRDCAVKLLLGERNVTVRERFVLEGQAAARLGKHPNIVQVFDAGVIDETAYIAMELVDGEPLDEVLKRRGAIEETELLEIARKVAMALGHAHQKGIVHRDMKPGNIVLDKSGEPLILDFGLAKDLGVADSALSTAGHIIGTPNFMPPEQADSKLGRVDPRSDVYSVGATMHHALSGMMPFRAERVVDTIVQVLTRDPPRLRPAAPVTADTEAIVLKAMEKEPRHRYQTALELADDLASVIAGRAPKARAVGPLGRLWRRLKRNPMVLVLGTLLLVLASAGSAYVVHRQGEADALWQNAYLSIARATANETRELLEPAIPLLRENHALAQAGLLPVGNSEQLAEHLTVRFRYRERLSWLSYGSAERAFTGVKRDPKRPAAIIVNRSWFDTEGGHLRENEVFEHGESKPVRSSDEWTYDPTKRPWYATAQRSDDPTWLKPYAWFDSAGFGITLTMALRQEGQMLGAFTADYHLQSLSQFLSTLPGLGEGGKAFLLTRGGQVIARSDLSANDAAHPALDAGVAQGGIELGDLATDDPVSVEFAHADEDYAAAFQSFAVDGGIQWVVAVVVPTRAIRGDVSSIATILLIAGGVLLGLTFLGLLVMFFRRRSRVRSRKAHYAKLEKRQQARG